MPQPGDPAPGFELSDQHGETVRLADLKGAWTVLYFYPKADTPGCTTQACGVRDSSAEYERRGVRVIGVSPDETREVAAFDDKYDLGFTLLADPGHAVADRYGVWVEKNMYGKKRWGIQRATFIIDPDGKIAKTFPRVQAAKHDELVLAALDELQA